MKRLLLTIALFLVGCAGLGIPTADTFNKRLLAGHQTTEAIASTAISLRKAGKLSDSDRDNVVATNRTAISGLDLAKQIHTTNPQAGNDKLTATITVLTALQAYLATKESK